MEDAATQTEKPTSRCSTGRSSTRHHHHHKSSESNSTLSEEVQVGSMVSSTTTGERTTNSRVSTSKTSSMTSKGSQKSRQSSRRSSGYKHREVGSAKTDDSRKRQRTASQQSVRLADTPKQETQKVDHPPLSKPSSSSRV